MKSETEKALDVLATAQSLNALRAAKISVKKAVSEARRRVLSSLGDLAKTFVAAMEIWDRQKDDGVSREDRIAGLSKTLRAAWPKGRDLEWRYLCAHCSDHGLVMETCPGDATCGRVKTHLPHEFGKPCWCPKGARFRNLPKTPEDVVTRAAKTKKPSGFSRVGR